MTHFRILTHGIGMRHHNSFSSPVYWVKLLTFFFFFFFFQPVNLFENEPLEEKKLSLNP